MWRRMAARIVAGVLVVLFAAGCLDRDDRAPPAPARADPCDAPVGERVEISETIPLGGFANLVAVGEGYVWTPVADAGAERVTLVRIDPASGAVTRTPYGGSSEVRIDTGGGAVWLADPQTRELTRIDVATGRRTITRPFGRRGPREMAVGPTGVWLVPERGGDLAVAGLDDGRVRRRVRTGVSTIGDVAPAGETVWLSAAGPPAVMRLDARTGELLAKPVRVAATALDIEATPEYAWVDLGEDDGLARVHARQPVLEAPDGGMVFAIALGFGALWATNYVADTVTRVDADTGERIGEPIPTGADPKGIAVGMGAVWVANAGECSLTRIDPRR
jgi:streptogramin lyase